MPDNADRKDHSVAPLEGQMSTRMHAGIRIRDWLGRLAGAECLGVIGGAGTGSVISVHLGNRRRRARQSKNQLIPELLRIYEGELIFFVQCAWRLETAGEIVCGSVDDNSTDGPMAQGLSRLSERRVLMASGLEPPGYDFSLSFDNGLFLRVFCDQMQADEGDNYVFFTPDTNYIVGPRCLLRAEPEPAP